MRNHPETKTLSSTEKKLVRESVHRMQQVMFLLYSSINRTDLSPRASLESEISDQNTPFSNTH